MADAVDVLQIMADAAEGKVKGVVESHSLRLLALLLGRMGGTGADSLGRRTRQLSGSTRASRVEISGNLVRGGVEVGAKYAVVHIGPKGTMFEIRPKNAQFLAIPLDAAKTAAGVARGRPRDSIWGPTFIAKGIIFGFSGGTKKSTGTKPIPLFVLKRSVQVPRRIDPQDLLGQLRDGFLAELAVAALMKGT
jgi:hypothetical protein